jgi:hypothetical protein
MPTVEEMAEWIGSHREKGASKGMSYLGFTTSTAMQSARAYIYFHNLLNDLLSMEDKATIGFHTAFTENLLCKTVRWQRVVEEDVGDRFEDIAEKAVQAGDTGPGKALPFAFPVTAQQFGRAFRWNNVCLSPPATQ